MNKEIFHVVLILMAVLLLPAGAQTVDDSLKQAVAKYPDLAHEGSELHTKFLQIYRQTQESDPALLADPNWPLILSDKAFALLAADAAASAPSASPAADPSPTASPAPSAPAVPPALSAPRFSPAISLSNAAGSGQSETIAGSTVGIVRDCAGIIFFIVTGTVVILTYNRAKKSIFAPLRIEAFKLQLKAFEDVFQFFEKCPPARIGDKFDLERIVYLNTVKLLDEYAGAFFWDQFKKEKVSKERDELFKDVVGGLAGKDSGEKYFQSPAPFQQQAKEERAEIPPEPVLILAKWKSYKYDTVDFTKSYKEATEQVRRFHALPLLPRELKAIISDFEAVVHDDLLRVGTLLTEVARELPTRYPTFEILSKADLSWIWSKYNHTCIPLEEKQNAILAYVENYLQVDNLLECKRKPPKEPLIQ